MLQTIAKDHGTAERPVVTDRTFCRIFDTKLCFSFSILLVGTQGQQKESIRLKILQPRSRILKKDRKERIIICCACSVFGCRLEKKNHEHVQIIIYNFIVIRKKYD